MELKRKGFKPDKQVYTTMLAVCKNAKNLERAEEIFKEI